MMRSLNQACLIAAFGAGFLWSSAPAQAIGWIKHHHHGGAASSAAFVAPMGSFGTFSSLSVPTTSFASYVTPVASFSNFSAPTSFASFAVPVAPAASFAVPATTYSVPMASFGTLSTGGFTSFGQGSCGAGSFGSFASLGSDQALLSAIAFGTYGSASSFEAQSATGRYPNLAAFAQAQGLGDGGTFVANLRNFLRRLLQAPGSLPGGGSGLDLRNGLTSVLQFLFQRYLGQFPGLSSELQQLINELLGIAGPANNGSDNCFTIRVCIEGGSGGGGAGAGGLGGGALEQEARKRLGQIVQGFVAAATPPDDCGKAHPSPQKGPSGEIVDPPDTDPAEARHTQVMEQLSKIETALGKIATALEAGNK